MRLGPTSRWREATPSQRWMRSPPCRRAAELLDRWSQLEPLAVLERARLAERLGESQMAIKSYQFVADMWRHADPELQPFVQEARSGLDRVMGESRGGDSGR